MIEELKFLGKFTKKKTGGGGWVGLGWWGGQGGCERRIEVVKIKKNGGGVGSGGGVGGGGSEWM